MSLSVGVNKFRVVASVGLISLVLGAIISTWSAPVAQANTAINARICGQNSQLDIVFPESDIVVSKQPIEIYGEVAQISQVEIYVNELYHRTVAIGFTQRDFTSSVGLLPGTHTLKFIGQDACSSQTVERELVLTYEPPPKPPVDPNQPVKPRPPSRGDDTQTEVPSDNPPASGGVIVSHVDNGNLSPPEKQSIFTPYWNSFLRISDLESLAYGSVLLNILRLVVVISGMFLIVGASGVVGLVARWREGEVEGWQLRLVQLLGLVLVIGALII